MSAVVNLRLATIDDCALLSSWDQEPHVIAATGDDDGQNWAAEVCRDADWQWIFIAEAEGNPLGVIQIIDPAREESHYWGDVPPNLRAIDIWIGPAEQLGRGHGSDMMRQAIDFCFSESSVEAILIDPLVTNNRARTFYERLGFRFIEERRFGNDDCAVYRLDRPR